MGIARKVATPEYPWLDMSSPGTEAIAQASPGIPRDAPLKLNPRPAVLPQCALSEAIGTGVSSRLSRICMMCSPKEMSRPFLDRLSGDIQGQDVACSLCCWSGDSWSGNEMAGMRRLF